LRPLIGLWHHRPAAVNLDNTGPRCVEFGGFRLDTCDRLLFRDGQLVALTPKAGHILCVLVESRGQLVTKEALLKAVWPETFVEEGNLAFNIHGLRRILNGDADGERFIETVRGRGYRFAAEVAAVSDVKPSELERRAPDPDVPRSPVASPAAVTAISEAIRPPAAAPRRLPFGIAAWFVAAAVLIVVSAERWPRSRAAGDESGRALVRLTNNLAEDRNADVSPDGRTIVFASAREGGMDVFVMDRNGGHVRNLTNNPAKDDAPTWSPDGKFIAFESDRDDAMSVFVMDADGGHPRRVASGGRPAWSHDGRWIAYEARIEGHGEVFVVAATGGPPRRITFDRDMSGDPSWAPGDETLAITSRRDGRLEIQTLRLDGSDRKTIVANGGDNRLPVWSPDGREILFNSSRDGFDSLFLVNADGTDVRRVTGGVVDEDEAAWFPDGRSIVFDSQRDGNVEIYRLRLPSDPDGAVRLTDNQASDDFPDWSPDGRWIAFESNRDGHRAIYAMDPAGGAVRALTERTANSRTPTWSPDGGEIAFSSDRDGASAIYIMNAEGAGVHRVTDGSEDVLPHWSPSGRELCFSRRHDAYVVAASGGAARRVGRGDTCAWSSDGRSLFVDYDERNVREVYRVSTTGGPMTNLTRNSHGNGGAVASRDGLRIAFNSNQDGHGFGLFLMSPEGLGQKRITSRGSFDFHPSWSPDGGWIVFGSSRDGNNQIYKVAAPRIEPGGERSAVRHF